VAPADSLARLRKTLLDRAERREASVTQLCREAGISRSRFYELRARYRQYGEENFRFAFDKKFEPAVIERFEANKSLLGRIFADPDFAERIARWAARELFERARAGPVDAGSWSAWTPTLSGVQAVGPRGVSR